MFKFWDFTKVFVRKSQILKNKKISGTFPIWSNVISTKKCFFDLNFFLSKERMSPFGSAIPGSTVSPFRFDSKKCRNYVLVLFNIADTSAWWIACAAKRHMPRQLTAAGQSFLIQDHANFSSTKIPTETRWKNGGVYRKKRNVSFVLPVSYRLRTPKFASKKLDARSRWDVSAHRPAPRLEHAMLISNTQEMYEIDRQSRWSLRWQAYRREPGPTAVRDDGFRVDGAPNRGLWAGRAVIAPSTIWIGVSFCCTVWQNSTIRYTVSHRAAGSGTRLSQA